MKPNAARGAAQARIGTMMVLIGGAAGALSLGINAAYGLTIHWTAAAAFMATDSAKIVAPMAAQQIGWNAYLRSVFLGGIAISVMAALNCWAAFFGAPISNAETAGRLAEADRQELARIGEQLATIGSAGDLATLEALAEGARERLDGAKQSAKKAGIDCTRRKACRDAASDHKDALSRLATARERETLAARRGEILARIAAAKPIDLGLAGTVAALSGLDPYRLARANSMIAVAAFIAALEALTLFCYYGLALRAAARKSSERAAPQAQPVTVIEPADDEAACLAKLQGILLNAPDGQLIASRDELAALLGVARSTVHDRLARWSRDGRIVKTAGPRRRTLLALPDR